jgi:hypothetical protein
MEFMNYKYNNTGAKTKFQLNFQSFFINYNNSKIKLENKIYKIN